MLESLYCKKAYSTGTYIQILSLIHCKLSYSTKIVRGTRSLDLALALAPLPTAPWQARRIRFAAHSTAAAAHLPRGVVRGAAAVERGRGVEVERGEARRREVHLICTAAIAVIRL